MFLDDNADEKLRFFQKLLGYKYDLLEARAKQFGKPDESAVAIYLGLKLGELDAE